MVKIKISIILLLVLSPFIALFARHIVGGELYYTWLRREGNNNVYRFTLNVYLDCNPDAQRTFDPTAALSIYQKTTNRLVDNTGVRLGERTRVAPPDNPCLIPPNICVQRGVYEWERALPIINDTYIVMYQICCRNETTNNIINPGASGNTYTVEITPASQQLNNNSPRFKSFPPTIICVNEPLLYDHSATDTEGDVLVYRFCTPFGGGGLQTGSGCAQTNPNPACWPSREVTFRAPYTFENPVGGNPVVQINTRTGRITGVPIVKGQFALVVCMEEYRNGQLLSIVKRDFQFNVAECTPLVRGRIKADEVIGKTYILKSCGDKTFSIDNQSFERNNIRNFRFEVDIQGNSRPFTDWNPVITLPDTGIFNGKLYLNEGLQCQDSIYLEFRVSPSIKADFSINYDTCKAGPVQFTSTTPYTSKDGISWQWLFETRRETIQNPIVNYETAGTKNVVLRVTNRFNCTDEIAKSFVYAPLPEQLNISPNNFEACSPAIISFNNLSRPIDSTYSVRWNFGDGNQSQQANPVHTYQQAGEYNVSLLVVSPLGCQISRTFNQAIKVRQGVKADFTYSPEILTSQNRTVDLTSLTVGANSWSWFQNNRFFARRPNASITFRDTGMQKITLFVSNVYDCVDSLTKTIDIMPINTYFLPNAFTPNYDGVNDEYIGTGLVEGMRDFTMRIFNRWGEMIFETNNPKQGWNGAKFNGTHAVQEGVYLCIVQYTTARGEKRELRSYATLLN
jgi:gliding motility-associated-like protein